MNIQLSRVLVGVFDDLIDSSPTFRAQCARIALTPYVRVTVIPALAKSLFTQGRARTSMRRYSTGALIATVEIPVPLTMSEYAELFGHEFEHIIEQIERVNLPALVLTGGGAAHLADGAYETRRAQRVGLQISAEHDRASTTGALPPAAVHQIPAAGAGLLPLVPTPRWNQNQQ